MANSLRFSEVEEFVGGGIRAFEGVDDRTDSWRLLSTYLLAFLRSR